VAEATREADATLLIDSPDDGAVEEYGWVPVQDAADEAAAINVLRGLTDPEYGMTYEVVGRSFHRPFLHLPQEDAAADAGWFVVEDKGPEDHEGHAGYWMEYLPWEACADGDEGAHEFWTLALAEEEVEDAD
jgi:hypothetical protein